MKQLSKHSIGAYMEICREINISIEAVAWIEPTIEVCDGDIDLLILLKLTTLPGIKTIYFRSRRRFTIRPSPVREREAS